MLKNSNAHADYIRSTLKESPVLAPLSAEALQTISEHSVIKKLAANEILFEQNMPATNFYFLKSGRVKLFRLSENGDEKIIEIIEAGNLFAFTLLFVEGSTYPVDAHTLIPSEAICIKSETFAALLRDSTDLCFSVMAAMSTRMMKLIQEIDALSLQTGSTRVKSYLLNHTSEEQPSFQLTVSKKTLALHLSIKPETFSRIFRCLIDSGQIKVNGKEIEVLNREKLFATICHVAE